MKTFSKVRRLLGVLVMLLLVSLCSSLVCPAFATGPINWKYKGMTLTAYWNDSFNNDYIEQQIDYYASLDINAIEVTPIWYQESRTSSKIERDKRKTISDELLRKVIKYAGKKGMKVNLKPHVQPYPTAVEFLDKKTYDNIIGHSLVHERERLKKCYFCPTSAEYCTLHKDAKDSIKKRWLTMLEKYEPDVLWRAHINPSEIGKWFDSYAMFLNHYVDIACEFDNVQLFTVGTEMVGVTPPRYLPRNADPAKISGNFHSNAELMWQWKRLMENLKDRIKDKPNKPYFLYAAHEAEVFGTPNNLLMPEECRKDEPFSIGEQWQKDGFKQIIRYSILDNERPDDVDALTHDFWDLFDYVSMTVYYELGEHCSCKVDGQCNDALEPSYIPFKKEKDGSIENFEQRWNEKLVLLDQWYNKLGLNEKKGVVIGELGYRSLQYGHYKPFQSIGPVFAHLNAGKEVYSGENQANAYRAMLNTFKQKAPGWLLGVFFWQGKSKILPFSWNPPIRHTLLLESLPRVSWRMVLVENLWKKFLIGV